MAITRRNLLGLGASAGLIAATRPLALSGGLATKARITVTIPSTGEQLPAVGIGTRDYRANTNDEEMRRFRQTLEVFHSSGGRVVDTSPNYGNDRNGAWPIIKGYWYT